MGTTDEQCRARCEKLEHLLQERGVDCTLYWDYNSPYGVRIWLTREDGPEFRTPSLYVLTEGDRSPHRDWCWRWFLSLGGFAEETDQALQDLFMEIFEWGEDDDTQLNQVAEAVNTFLRLLIVQDVTPEPDDA